MPKDLRHLVHVLSVLAKSETGAGYYGQEKIAAAMGCSERHVRALLSELEKPNDCGVMVRRTARFRSDGRGRSSDSWVLILDQTNRNSVPPEQRSAGTASTTNRNTTTDQPEQRSGDLRSDRRSERRSEARRSRASHTVPDDFDFDEKDAAVEDGARKRGVDVDDERRRWKGHTYQKPMRDFHAAWRNWLNRSSPRFQHRGGVQPQPMPAQATFLENAEHQADALAKVGGNGGLVVPLRVVARE